MVADHLSQPSYFRTNLRCLSHICFSIYPSVSTVFQIEVTCKHADASPLHPAVFFTHCHPHRLIVHSASFHADLCRGRVPSYLLNAICAVSAPLSQNPLVRVSPIRESGRKFVETALAELFDSEGQLKVTGVDVAQTLVLIQTYNVYKESRMQGQLQLYGKLRIIDPDLELVIHLETIERALHIIHSLRILETGNQASDAASLSADELYTRAIQRESARRTFWVIHLVELLGAVFTRRPTTYSLDDLAGVRLPCDEASFDLALEVPLGVCSGYYCACIN